MSRSDCGGEKAMAVAGSIDDLTADAHAGALPPAGLRAVMSAAIRLYAGAVEAAGVEIAPANPEISATDAMVLACALVRSRTSLRLIWRCGFPERLRLAYRVVRASLARANRCWVLMLCSTPPNNERLPTGHESENAQRSKSPRARTPGRFLRMLGAISDRYGLLFHRRRGLASCRLDSWARFSITSRTRSCGGTVNRWPAPGRTPECCVQQSSAGADLSGRVRPPHQAQL